MTPKPVVVQPSHMHASMFIPTWLTYTCSLLLTVLRFLFLSFMLQRIVVGDWKSVFPRSCKKAGLSMTPKQEQSLTLSFTNYQHIHSFALWTNTTITPLNKKAITNGQGDIQKPLYSLFALTVHLGWRLPTSLPKMQRVARMTTTAFPMHKPLRAWAPPRAHMCKIRSLPP